MRSLWLAKSNGLLLLSIAAICCLLSCGGPSSPAASSDPGALTSIATTFANSTISEGATDQFTATGTYSNGSTQNLTSQVTWNSSNTAVATISTSGLATGVAVGSTTIQASLNGVHGSAQLAVTAATLQSIAVTATNLSIAQGTTDQFTATGTYSNGSTQNLTSQVTWSSSNTAVATISTSGLATSVAVGSTTLQASLSGVHGSAQLAVTAATLQSIAVTATNLSIAQGTTDQFTATGTYSNGSTQNLTSQVTWSSSNTAVATISTSGLATGVAVGGTTIEASLNGIHGSAQVAVTIGTSNPSVSSVTLNPSTLVGGNPSQGTVTLTGPAPSGGATVTLMSSNTSVATVVPSSITIGAGLTSGTFNVNTVSVTASTQVTITASYSSTSAMAALNVNPSSGTQPTFVQGAANNGSNVSNISTAFGSSVQSGHLLVAAVGYAGVDLATVTLTLADSLHNTWVPVSSAVRRTDHGVAQLFYAVAGSSGADTVTVTASIPSVFLELYVHEYSGVSALDASASGQGSSTTPSTAVATTLSSNELIFGYALLTNPGAAGSGFTARETLGGDVSEDKLAATSGSYSATFSQPSGGQWIALMATFEAGADSVRIISPKRAALTVTQGVSVTATTTDPAGVKWIATAGSFSSSTSLTGVPVTYTAPSSPGSYTITATSMTDMTQSSSIPVYVTDLGGVYTYHNDLARDGANTQEYALTPSTVSTSTFGKLFSCTVDGAVYAQPLWVANLTINGAQHNVVFVATQHDSLYAFDADASSCVQLLAGQSDRHQSRCELRGNHCAFRLGILVGSGCDDITPEVGVTGTPVIDPSTNTLYVVSKSMNSGGTSFFQRLHAIDITSGNREIRWPCESHFQHHFPGHG